MAELFGAPVDAPEIFGAPVDAPAERGIGSTFTDIGRGIAAGPVTIAQGLTELGALASDIAFGTNAAPAVTEAFEEFKRERDLKPSTTAGKIAEEITAFGVGVIPIAGWLGRAGSVARGGARFGGPARSTFMKTAEKFGNSPVGKKLLSTRAGLIGATALAAGGYEFLITPDGRPTVSDSFDVMPDILKTEARISGLTGREEGLRRLRNRLRSATEAATFSAAVDVAFPVLGATARAAGTIPGVSEVTSGAARLTLAAFDKAAEQALRVPGAKSINESFKKWFTASGGLDPRVFEELSDTLSLPDAAKKQAIDYFTAWDRELRKAVGGMKLLGKRRRMVKEANENLYAYLTGNNAALDAYPTSVKQAADRMRGLSFRFEDNILAEVEKALAEKTPGTPAWKTLNDARQVIKDHQSKQQAYIRRLYERYENPELFYRNLDLNSPLFAKAVDEVTYNINMMNSSLTMDQARAQAEKLVYKQLGLDAIQRGGNPELALRNVRTAAANARKKTFLPPSAKLDIASDMFIAREPLMDLSPSLRKLMGEIEDPREAFVRTINDTAETVSALRFYQNLSDEFSVRLDKAVEALEMGIGRPAVVSKRLANGSYVDIASQLEESLVSAHGYRLLEGDSLNPFKGTYGGLSDHYVSPELYDALTTSGKLGQTAMSEAAALAVQAKGLSQRMTVVMSPVSQVRNILGGMLFLAANANFGRDANFFDALRMFTGNLANLDDAAAQKFAKIMSALGVIDQSIVAGQIRKMGALGKDLGVAGRTQRAVDKAIDSVGLMRWLERTYSDSDSLFKVMTVLGEQSKLLTAMEKAGLDSADPILRQELLRNGLAKRPLSAALANELPDLDFTTLVAADITKDVMPTYSRVAPAVKAFDMIPLFGNFVSFASENIRNSVNTLSRGMKEMAFRVSDAGRAEIGEAAAVALERQIRGIGAQRIASYLSVASVMPRAATKAAMAATEMTDEDMTALHRQLAPFLKGHEISPIKFDRDAGKVEYIDQSYVNPYAFVTDAAKAALRTYQEKGYMNASELEQISSAAWTGLIALAEPFGAESLVFERLRDVLPLAWIGRGGVTQTGAEIYSSSASLGERLSKGFTHVLGGFLPGFARMVVEERGGKLEPGRLTRGMYEIPGAQGQEFTTQEELARLITGFTPMVLDMKKDFWYNGAAYTPLRTDAKQQATAMIKRNDSTVEDMTSAWGRYLDNLYREQSKLYAQVQAARQLGLSEEDIEFNLIDKAGLGKEEALAIMDGEFYPTTTTRELMEQLDNEIFLEEQPRLVTDIPYDVFDDMSLTRLSEPLDPRIYEEQIDVDRKGPSWFEVAPGLLGAPAPEPAFTPRPAPAPVSGPAAAAPTFTPRPAMTATPSPALLGSNPIDAAKNAEIAQRLQSP